MINTVIVLTRSREGTFAYLEELIGLWEDGFPLPTIVCDVSDRSAEEQIAEEQILKRLSPDVVMFRRPAGTLFGNKLAYWRCIELAAEAGGDALILEDDVEPCTNALRRMALFPVPADLGYVTFFAPAVFQGPNQHPGLWRTPTALNGTQAVKYSEAALGRLAGWAKDAEFQPLSASDTAVAFASDRLKIRHGAHCPELVQHTGEVSANTPGWKLTGRNRLARTYPGRNFDALALFSINKAFL